MEDKRVADYFVVAGLPDNPRLLDDTSRDGNSTKTPPHSLVPITDIAVIIRSQGEVPPKGYECIETTPLGFVADLNHGSLRSPNVYLCYRRGRDKPPLVDVGVLYDGKERVMFDSEVVDTTPCGRSANVNNGGSRTFLTYRRAPDNAPCNQLVVTDICIILANKGEHAPRAFCRIAKNLNKGMLGSDVFLCYKKSMNRPDRLTYEPGILGRFPLEDYESFLLPQSVALFCLPMGATIECWPKSATEPKPVFSTFVLTCDSAEKVYGAAVTFYEKFPDNKLSETLRTHLVYTTEDHKRTKGLHANKSICILSRWPFFDTFEEFLRYLHRMSVTGPHRVPLERMISYFMLEIPFPSPQRPRILIQLSDRIIPLEQPEDTPLPLSGASFIQFLKNLGPDNCLKVLFYVLTEQKILFHSLRPDVLTGVAEAVVQLIFPFHWQCPYIPLCPLGLSDVLSAPLPFLVGVDSRYFDLYEPPHDVICVDLDTNSMSEEKRNFNFKILPKRPARMLRNMLQTLYNKLGIVRPAVPSKNIAPNDTATLDYDFTAKKKRRQIELDIQEACLRFTSSLLKGYRQYLKPITTAPTIGTTDTSSLFDLQGFLRSRDKTHSRFFAYLVKTQMFIRFIEERSFVSDKDVSLAFFDECTEKVDGSDSFEVKLLEIDDSQTNDRTVFIAPPEPIGLPPGLEYKYKEFGTLKPQLFHRHPAKSLLSIVSETSLLPSSPLARRTKQEIKNAQKYARKQSEIPVMWAKCLVGYCFSLWFIHLPSYVKSSSSKSTALRLAFEVLVQMQLCRLSAPEEVCYRVLMLLCGLYSQPTLAVKVLFEMKRHGIQPNAITYGYYNKAVLESKWPSTDAGRNLMWNRLRNVIIGVAQFRQGIKKKARRSLSLCSDIDYDRISRTSAESSNPDETIMVKVNYPTELVTDLIKLVDDQNSSGGQSDGGYSSLCQEESAALQKFPVTEDEKENANKDSGIVLNMDSDSSSSKKETKCDTSKSLKICEIDFSASDAFRSRVGSIVKTSATSMSNLAKMHNATVDSSAGILMTSQAFLYEDCSLNGCDYDYRKRHKSAGEHGGIHSYNLHHHHCKSSVSKIPSPFLRSYSFGNDFQIIRKIREAKENLEKNGITAKLFDSPLKKNYSLDKKRDEKDSKNFGLSRCDEESETELEISACNLKSLESDVKVDTSVKRLSVASEVSCSSNTDVLSKSNISNVNDEDAVFINLDCNASEPSREKDFLLNTLTPLKEAWQNFDLFSSNRFPRMASSISNSLGFSTGSDVDQQKRGRKVTRSSTFHHGSPVAAFRNKTKVDAEYDTAASVGKISRSSTLPVPPRSKSATCNTLPGLPPQGGNFFVGSSFGISRLTSKHSEVFLDSLKSAVTSVSSKINEIRSSLSASNTPIKSNNSPVSHFDRERMIMYGDDDICGCSTDGRQITMDYSNCNGFCDDAFGKTDSSLRDSLNRKYEQRHSLPHVGSAPTFSSQIFEIFEKHHHQRDIHSDNSRSIKIAVEVTMTTCSRCTSCCSLLYDEEIMEGWSADDSNLNTQCTFCKAKFVPLLTVTIRDFRWESSVESLLTPANSNENVYSSRAESQSSLLNSIFNNPDILGEEDSTQNLSTSLKTDALLAHLDVNNSEDKSPAKTKSELGGKDYASSSSRNSVCSVTDTDLVGSSNARLTHQNSSTHLYGTSIRKPLVDGNDIEPITVPYLSPLVLRKEIENVLESEGDNCMTKSEFVDQHPIIYWNLVWFFKRIGVPSHLSSLALEADSVTKGKKIPDEWLKENRKNVLVRCSWDNIKLHENMGPPLYVLWTLQENENECSSLVHALVTDERNVSKSVMKQVLAKLQCNDLYSPICILLNERRKCLSIKKYHHSIYREILFLSFVAIGKENIDNLQFDVEYRRAYEKLSDKQLSQINPNDKPPSEGAVFCRRYFKELELKLR